MYRNIHQSLQQWKANPEAKPLILRGARQVGKTYAVRELAQEFENHIEINFETDLRYRELFESMDIKEILETLSVQNNIDIERGKTLIFLDEIQECPKAIQMLRYFYEQAQGLHVIAAGSLLEFVLNSADFKFPVGRVSFLYLGPLSFYEFLLALGKDRYLEQIQNLSLEQPLNSVIHEDLLKLLRLYFLVGGMPDAVNHYVGNLDDLDGGLKEAFTVQREIIQAYQGDFGRYASKTDHDDLRELLRYIPKNLGNKFKYSKVYPDARSSSLRPALNLLKEAGVAHKILRSPADLPLGAGSSPQHFKVNMLDIGLAMCIYDFDYEDLSADRFWHNISGGLTEQFVGQELLAMRDPQTEAQLYYWARESHQSTAEIDYLIKIAGKVFPLEVKAGATGRLKSLHMFRDKFDLPFGLRVSQKQLELENGVLSLPLYAIPEIPRIVSAT